MSINFNISDAVESMGNNTFSPSIAMPNNVQEGDLIVVVFATLAYNSDDGVDRDNLPTGWANNFFNPMNGQASYDLCVVNKLAGASEPSSYDFTLKDDIEYYAIALRLTNIDLSTYETDGSSWRNWFEAGDIISQNSFTTEAGDTAIGDGLILHMFCAGDTPNNNVNQGQSMGLPPEATLLHEYVSDGSETGVYMTLATEPIADGEVSQPRTFTFPNATTATYGAIQIKAGASQFEITDPQDGETDVSDTPLIQINNPDGFTDLNYQVSKQNNFSNIERNAYETSNSHQITDPLDPQTQYFARVRRYTKGGLVNIFLYEQLFDSPTAWDDDFTITDLSGTGGTFSVSSNEGVISTDVSSRHAGLLNNINFRNFEIVGEIEFDDVSTNCQPSLHFRTQGDQWSNNFIPSYYIYFLGEEIRLGRVDGNFNPSDYPESEGGRTTFSRTVNTRYEFSFFAKDNRLRFMMWEKSGTRPSDYSNGIDYIDQNNRFSEGGFAIKNAVGSANSATVIIDKLQVTGSEYVEVVTPPSVDDISVSPTGATINDGETIGFQGTILTSGNEIDSGTFEKNSGDSDIVIQSQLNNTCIIEVLSTASDGDLATFTFRSDADPTKFVNFTVTASVASVPVTGGEAEDIAILEEISTLWDMPNQDGVDDSWTLPMTLDPAPDGITVETINGELRVTEINLKDRGITTTNGLPNSLENLTEMEEINLRYNYMTGPMRTGLFKHQKCKRVYLNHPSYHYDDPDEEIDNGAGKENNGKRKTSKPDGVTQPSGPWNDFSGPITEFDMPELEYFYVTWMHNVGGTIPAGFWNSKKLIKFGWGETNMEMQTLPDDAFDGMYQLDGFLLNIEGNRGQGRPHFEGAFPSSLNASQMNPDFRHMSIGGNLFTSLPDTTGFSKLESFGIAQNELQQPFEAYWIDGSAHPNIRRFSCSWNQITGQLPQTVPGPLPDFDQFTVTGNLLTGQIPTWLFDMPDIINFGFEYNQFTGSLPEDLSHMSQGFWKIRNMRFGHNQLSGNIPKMDWLSPIALSKLTRCTFGNNNYVTDNWNMIDDGREYVFTGSGSFEDTVDLEASENSPIVQKTRREWWYYHCHPDGGSRKGLRFGM